MVSFITELGAFAFGTIIGWFVYFTNRYRKGDVQFSDLTALLGVIGGAAITALFGDAKTILFGAYGLGLAVGFFAYFVALIVFVRLSGNVFAWTWFLDGRRKNPGENESIPGEARASAAAFDPGVSEDVAIRTTGLAVRTPLSEVAGQKDRAIAATVDCQRELVRRIGDTTDDGERAQLRISLRQLNHKIDELVALRLKDILDSGDVRAALVKLEAITRDLEEEGRNMKEAANAIAVAADVVSKATKVIGFLMGILS